MKIKLFLLHGLLINVSCCFSMDLALRKELLRMVDVDQQARLKLIQAPQEIKDEAVAYLARIDAKHTQRMKKFIIEYGWPDEILVGPDGSNAAWLIVQHSPDLMFQKKCLLLLEMAVKEKKCSPKHYAYLYDRVAIRENRPQLFGTQFTLINEKCIPFPIENKVHVDERRQALGLCNLADYISHCEGLRKK